MKKLIFIILGLIIYGSLYPFQFTFEIPSSNVVNKLLDFNIFHTKITDAVANVLLFTPLGILLFYRSLKLQQSLLSMFLLCFVFAFMIQVTQLYLEARVAYGADAIWNVIGFANGIAIGNLINRFYQVDSFRLERDKIINLVLLALLIVALLRPFSPTLDPGLIWQNVKQLFAIERVNLADILDSLAIYILLVAVIAQLNLRLQYAFILVLLSLLLQFFMVDGGALLNDIAAALLVIPLCFLNHRFKSYSIWSGVAVGCYFFANVTPFEFSDSIKRFYEIPFQAYLSGSMMVNASAMIYKFTFFVTILWLVRSVDVSLRKMTALLAGIVFIIELLQTRLILGTPDITDVLLVLFAGWLTQTQLLPVVMASNTNISNLPIEKKAPKQWLGLNIDVIFVMFSAVIAQALIMRLPNLPYNVSELYGKAYGIVNYVFLAGAYLLFCIGAVWVARGIIKKEYSALKAPVYVAIVSMLVLVCLYLSVTKESVMDINGSSNIIYQLTGERILGDFAAEFVLWLGTENVAVVTRLIEPYIRFAALTGPLIYLLIFWILIFQLINERSSQHQVRKVARYALSFLPWFFLCKLIAFDYSSTDNLNELIARDGYYGLGGGGYLYLLLVLLTFTVVFSAWSLRFKSIKLVLLSVLMFVLSLPINWFLLNNGLEQQVQKYGKVFSGVDFLLGPNRSILLEQHELFARWVFVNFGIYLALSLGILLGLKQFLHKSTSAEMRVDTAVKKKNHLNVKKYMKSGIFIIILSFSAVFIVSISHKTAKVHPTPSWAINDANLIIDLHT
ncbi:MAG: VanZ family protein, partial [Paraglaciecola sp.]|nr:VanZ family protein [Paraglaciecola sp.]